MSTTAGVYGNTVQSLVQGAHINIQTIVFTLFLLFLASKASSYRRGLQAVNHLPGLRVLFHPTLSLPGVLLPTTWWNPGLNFLWQWRHRLYAEFGNDTISIVPFLLGPPTIHTRNVDVIHQIVASNSGKSFQKPDATRQVFRGWGVNLLTAERDVWRRHRRIMGPAFNSKLYESVWAETLKTYREMVTEEGWTTKDRVSVSAVQTLSTKFALLIIGKCGFGFSFNWSDPPRTADGRVTIQQALRTMAKTFSFSAFAPEWMRKLPLKMFKEALEAQQEIMKFMQESVVERKADIHAGGFGESDRGLNAFSMLVEASESEDEKLKLDDSELIGNVFIMLFAGHETTARSIAATIALLSIHNDLQEELHEHIISVIGYERDPVYDDYTKLNKVLAVFFESMRMFPPAYIMLREASEDTILQIASPEGREGTVSLPIAKGTQVAFDLIGAHYNDQYFENPEEFRPSRWYDIPNDRDTFYAFSVGPRTCIGNKFASTEVVCFFTMLLRDYKVEPVLKKSETKEQWRERILRPNLELTLGVQDVPVAFVRRINK